MEKQSKNPKPLIPSTPQHPSPPHNPSQNLRKSLMNIELSESIWETPKKFDRFLVITPTGKDVSFKEYSPLKIGKALRTSCFLKQTNSVEKTGKSITVEVKNAADSASLLKIKSFLGQTVEVTPHKRLNTSRGVIRSWEFKNTEPEEWKEVPGVLEARQILTKKEGKEVKTPLWVLTFDQPIPPVTLQVEYLRLEVRPFVRKPLRCFNCQKYGHQGKHCRGKKTCANCGKAEEHVVCPAEAWCPNCRESGHSATSKNCPRFLKEKLILEKMAQHGGSYFHVRDQLFPKTRTYLQAASQNGKTVTQTESSEQKNRKRRSDPIIQTAISRKGESPPSKKLLNQIERENTVPLKNRYELLSEINEDRFNFTGLSKELMDQTPSTLSSSSPPANPKHLQDPSPAKPKGWQGPSSIPLPTRGSPPTLAPPDPPPPPIPPPPIPPPLNPPPPSTPGKPKGNVKTYVKPCPASKKKDKL